MIEPELWQKGEDFGWYEPVYHLSNMPNDLGEDEDGARYEAHDAGEGARLDALRRVLAALWQENPGFEDGSDLGDILAAALHVAFDHGWSAAKAFREKLEAA